MGVEHTGAIYKGFTFDGVDSKDYGVYISGEAVFNSPERDVEMIEIPGRNGAFALDKGRFYNIEVTYPAGIFGDTESDFAQGISALRNILASKKGYCRLEDDYNSDEYRMAVYKSGLDVTPAQLKAGEFDIVFECKPQRFLKSGENAVAVASGGTLTNPTLFESHPLLEVDGYGTITINGEEVVLHNEPLGRVQLGGGDSYKNTITYQFDQSQFNTGDFITVPDYRRTFQFDMVKPYGSGEIVDFQVTSMTAPDYIFSSTKYQGSLTLLTDASIFTVGTARTDSYNVVGKISYKNSSGTASEADFRATAIVAYDGNGSITFTASKFATDASFVYTTVAGNAPNFYGDSTWQPVTDTAYIDLDIGEAYVIDGGNVVGINNVVDLPAELPTLTAGTNTITFDNTITQFEIVSRWWRV